MKIPNIRKVLGANVKFYRYTLGYTQEQLAEKCDLSPRYISDIENNEDTKRIIKNFIDRQDSNLVGGVVLRKYIDLKTDGFHEKSKMPISEEYRVFIFNGKVLIIDNYWQADNNVKLSDDEVQWIQDQAQKIKSNFVTMDLARKTDDKLIIMELGDGQVSGLQQIKPENFYEAFTDLK